MRDDRLNLPRIVSWLKTKIIQFVTGKTRIYRAFFLYFPLSSIILFSIYFYLVVVMQSVSEDYVFGREPGMEIQLQMAFWAWMLVPGLITFGIFCSVVRAWLSKEMKIIHKIAGILMMGFLAIYWLVFAAVFVFQD